MERFEKVTGHITRVGCVRILMKMFCTKERGLSCWNGWDVFHVFCTRKKNVWLRSL